MKQSSLKSYSIDQLLKLYDNGKLKNTAQLIVLLDKLFSYYIRAQSATCVLLQAQKPWNCDTRIQAGHVFSRKCLALRFDENNVYPQCATCNLRHSMGSDHNYYHNWLKQRIGIHEYTKLEQIYTSMAPVKLSKQWHIDKIEHYRALYKNGSYL